MEHALNTDGQTLLVQASIENAVDLLDALTGQTRGSVPLDWAAPTPFLKAEMTPDRQHFLMSDVSTSWDETPGFWEKLRSWLPGPKAKRTCSWARFEIIDLTRRQRIFSLSQPCFKREPFEMIRPCEQAVLSDNGRILLTVIRPDKEEQPGADPILSCWDVSSHKPWRWILGPPLGLAAVTLGLATWRSRRRAGTAP